MNKLVQIPANLIITEGLTFLCLEHLWHIIPFMATKSLIPPNKTQVQKAVTRLFPNCIKK